DVAHYVETDSPLDQEAVNRGTSVYFPNRVIPMLPEALSNGLCSLKPKVDRLALVCDMHISTGGKVIKSRFAKAVMHSAARLTYQEVFGLLWEKTTAPKKYTRIMPHLEHLKSVYEVLIKARHRRGAVDLELPQSRFTFDDEGKISGVIAYPRNHAHQLIEECMITANVEAARFLKKARIPALYRNHPPPDDDRVERLAGFLQTVGLSLPRRDGVTPKDFNQVAKAISVRPDASALAMNLLRAMMQAVYEPKCEGHFGLALKEYAHFTSPIRRYPDLLVHRAITHVLAGGKPAGYRYSAAQMEDLGQQCSTTERRAEEASRDVEKWLKCEFMLDKVGEEFDGIVTGVTEFGIFVELNGMLIEGLVHVTALGNDYYTFDHGRQQLVGRRSGDRYTLATAVRVRVAGVSIEDRKIDFELVDAGSVKKNKTPYADKQKNKQRKRNSGAGKARNKRRRQ
ncbi:MAG: VacB/RNase II family 3'-5' exoribonuclease, partial [Gammaproteobacteria bacterium]|nr:VacB/RNase II family 3'-5' exoribonuclease [Gammaproteobacteria bacterium]